MFLGEYSHTLDSKGRLTIPSKFRDYLAPGMVITRNPTEECLMALPLDEWETIKAKVDALPKMDRNANKLRRGLFGLAEDLKPDKQGRILISQRLRDYAKITSQVVVIGMSTHIELWSPAVWDDLSDDLNDDMIEAFGV